MLWNLVSYLFGVTWVMSRLVRESLLGVHNPFEGKKGEIRFRGILLCVKSLGKERNS